MCLLCLSPKYIQDLSLQDALSVADKYRIAKEVAHILNDDDHEGKISMKESSGKNGVIAYVVMQVALSVFLPCSLPVSHFLSCTACYAAKSLTEYMISHHQQQRAEQLAAKLLKRSLQASRFPSS